MQAPYYRVVLLGLMVILGGCTLGPEVTHHASETVDEEGARRMAEAEQLLEAEEFDRAHALLLEITARYPAYFRAHRALQECTLQTEGLNAVQEQAAEAVAAERSPLTLTLMARLQQDWQERIRLLKEALALDETYVWAYYGIAYSYLQAMNAQDYERARRNLEIALEHDTHFPEARRLLIETLNRVGDADEEALQYGLYIDSHPEDLDARYNYADLLRSKLDEEDDALEQLDIILAEDPSRLDAQLLKGIVLCQAGDYEKAADQFLKLSNAHPNALLNLAFLYRDYMGLPDRALACFQKYLDYSGPHADEKTFFDRKILVPNYMEELKKELQ